LFFQSVTGKETVFSRDSCSLTAIFVISYNDSLTSFQKCMDLIFFPCVWMLESDTVTSARKECTSSYAQLRRMPNTDSCSRNSDETVDKGQCT
jgi:hypothetical protein